MNNSMKKQENTPSFLFYSLERWWLPCVLVFVFFVWYFFQTCPYCFTDFSFWNVFLPASQLLVILATTALFVLNARESWINQFRMVLSVDFRLSENDSLLMRAVDYPLSETEDIRSLAQQIGGQLSGIESRWMLSMSLVNEYGPPVVSTRERLVRYKAVIYLNEAPKNTTDEKKKKRTDFLEHMFTSGAYLHAVPRKNRGDIREWKRETGLGESKGIVQDGEWERFMKDLDKEKKSTSITIDLNELFSESEETAKLDKLPDYERIVREQAGSGADITLTGAAPVWLYLRIAHLLHGIARTLTYDSPNSGPVLIFDHNPH